MKRYMAVCKWIIFLLALTMAAAPVLALTPDEIAVLKEAGVEESTIRLMITESRPGVGEVEDEQGSRYIRYSTGTSRSAKRADREEAGKMERAWEMLRNIVIDGRQ